MLERNGNNNEDGSFNWRDALVDAGIISGMTFFTSLGGASFTGSEPYSAIMAAGISAAAQFFAFLALKRGLRKKE